MGMAYGTGKQEVTALNTSPHSGTSPQHDTVPSVNDLSVTIEGQKTAAGDVSKSVRRGENK